MKTVYNAYYFDVRNPSDKAAWEELKALLKGGPRLMESWGGGSHYNPKLNGVTVDLETKHLFSNQWNTGPIEGVTDKGLRVFDWAKDYEGGNGIGAPKGIKRGHYLTQTPEMKAIRDNVNTCGFCGFQTEAARGDSFCPKCIDSEYLKESDLKLTRMVCISESDNPRPELTEAEKAHLLPIYRDAQLHGRTERGIARLAKQRADLKKKYEKALHVAEVEFQGFTWLMDHGIKTDNVIYYSHVDRFSFGWRQPVSQEYCDALLNVISEFPYAYEIKREGLPTLAGY